MGTKLGSIHVLGAGVEEVSALLPRALVGQWSERFVSAFHEEFQWGTVERRGLALSRKLPAATVLSAALFDDDVVSLELFQAGKRLTGHLLNPYEGKNTPGKVPVFCQALGLPQEDEGRLRALWKKGNACEQLELTAALLGAPLWADAQYPPDRTMVRDAPAVDAWLSDHPDPPKVKNVTRAELVQELKGVQLCDHKACRGEVFSFYGAAGPGAWSDSEILRYRLLPNGQLEFQQKVRGPEREPVRDWPRLPDREMVPVAFTGERLYAYRMETCADPAKDPVFHFFSYDADGTVRGERAMPWNTELVQVGPEGDLWLGENMGRRLVHLDRNLKVLARSPDFGRGCYTVDMALAPDGKSLLYTSFSQRRLRVLDAGDLSLRRELVTGEDGFVLTADDQGRFWVQVSESTLTAYDETLKLLSRHRLKGSVAALRPGRAGELMAYTQDYNRMVFRVYRIT